ncbi:hypothetical protein GCM10027059_07080 [Myceligenerans halotolerans]
MTYVRGEDPALEIGVISGFVLKALRGAVGHTQAGLAERLAVDVSTVQGWESGRRPLAALRAADLMRLRLRLVALGAPLDAAAMLIEAVDADMILTMLAQSSSRSLPSAAHPLGTSVHRRTLVSLLTWPFTGIAPRALRHLPRPRSRGPVSDRPVLDPSLRSAIFDHVLAAAERARHPEGGLLRRQAAYLLGFDQRSGTDEWLLGEYTRAIETAPARGDAVATIHGRSAALALARLGDRDPLRRFIDVTLADDAHAEVNLTYWAYWLGEIPAEYADDHSMVRHGQHAWAGNRLLDHLLHHLDDPRNGPLNIHSLATVVAARPALLSQNPAARVEAARCVEAALDGNMGRHATSDLNNVRYAIRLAAR